MTNIIRYGTRVPLSIYRYPTKHTLDNIYINRIYCELLAVCTLCRPSLAAVCARMVSSRRCCCCCCYYRYTGCLWLLAGCAFAPRLVSNVTGLPSGYPYHFSFMSYTLIKIKAQPPLLPNRNPKTNIHTSSDVSRSRPSRSSRSYICRWELLYEIRAEQTPPRQNMLVRAESFKQITQFIQIPLGKQQYLDRVEHINQGSDLLYL